jgi:predicted alpha/beta-hydrolase family hydrolase
MRTTPMSDVMIEGPADAASLLVLAHGAGAPMTSPFLRSMSELLAARGVATARFEFAYMAARRQGGARKPPPRAERLVPEYLQILDGLAAEARSGQRLLIGGKSMGGRVASLAADELYRRGRIAGLVCLGYPFHPPNRPSELRTAHLAGLACPTLIVQGERDPFGGRGEVEGYALSPAIRLAWIGDGDHDLGPRGGSGFTRKGNLQAAADAVASFAQAL